jgi:hypothetical protein
MEDKIKLSFVEKILLKGAVKEEKKQMKYLILFYEICFVLLALILIYLSIIKNKISLISDAIFLIFLVIFIITIRTYQSLIRKIRRKNGVRLD